MREIDAMNTLISAQTMHLLMLIIIIGMELLAAFYLRQRRMPVLSYLGWGLLAVLLPVVGPFWVILSQPGRPLLRTRSARGLIPLRRSNLPSGQ